MSPRGWRGPCPQGIWWPAPPATELEDSLLGAHVACIPASHSVGLPWWVSSLLLEPASPWGGNTAQPVTPFSFHPIVAQRKLDRGLMRHRSLRGGGVVAGAAWGRVHWLLGVNSVGMQVRIVQEGVSVLCDSKGSRAPGVLPEVWSGVGEGVLTGGVGSRSCSGPPAQVGSPIPCSC